MVICFDKQILAYLYKSRLPINGIFFTILAIKNELTNANIVSKGTDINAFIETVVIPKRFSFSKMNK